MRLLDIIYGRHHDAFMRTTLTLEPEVAQLIDDEVHRTRRPFKQVVNDALRRGLSPRAAEAPAAPYQVRPHRATLLAGVDRGRMNALADELEDDALLGKPSERA
jgi:hypothetical protein